MLLESFKGTLFRFSLRTKEIAETSQISHSEMTEGEAKDYMTQLMNESENLILFLRNVKHIEFFEKKNGKEME